MCVPVLYKDNHRTLYQYHHWTLVVIQWQLIILFIYAIYKIIVHYKLTSSAVYHCSCVASPLLLVNVLSLNLKWLNFHYELCVMKGIWLMHMYFITEAFSTASYIHKSHCHSYIGWPSSLYSSQFSIQYNILNRLTGRKLLNFEIHLYLACLYIPACLL